jgi:hypothetical protein
MKLTRAELNYLALPGLIALIVILAGIGTVLVTESFLQSATADLDRAKAERSAIQMKLIHATDEEREIRASLVDYQRMRQRGIIGAEHRLDWVDAVKNVKNELGIYDIRYAINAQGPLQYPGLKNPPGVQFLDSRMKIDSDLLHEGDLFNMLAAFRNRLAPYVIVRSCAMKRDPAARPDTYGPHVQAHCDLDLVTIQDSGEHDK